MYTTEGKTSWSKPIQETHWVQRIHNKGNREIGNRLKPIQDAAMGAIVVPINSLLGNVKEDMKTRCTLKTFVLFCVVLYWICKDCVVLCCVCIVMYCICICLCIECEGGHEEMQAGRWRHLGRHYDKPEMDGNWNDHQHIPCNGNSRSPL